MPQDARNKLRQMGGITAAFPEMVQAQQEMPMAPVYGPAPATGSMGRALSRDPIRELIESRGMGGALSEPPFEGGRAAQLEAARRRQPEPLPVSEGSRSRSPQVQEAERALEEARKQKLLEIYGPGSEGGPTRPQDIAARATELVNIPTEDPETGGGGDGEGDGDTPAAPTLRDTYNEELSLVMEVLGEDDKDAARDKALTLAMVGLAALTGPRGQLLQNLAEGALIGLSATGKRRERQREREQEFKTLAMQGALAELDADRRERLQKEMFNLEAELRRELQANELAAELLGDTGVSAPTGSAVLNYLSSLTKVLLETGEAETFEEASRMAREELAQQFPEIDPDITDDMTDEERAMISGLNS